ncbi:uncharacterized transposon-derived protein F54H12.3 [Trichonephila inaurata madagascariensis]|uniref:Uncharacterized transposon-derived protein F54H12.3 n=1 Tax=Trichonephila inaurata madagascariensis TaxID=2747483 RepID=A0A8X6XUN4_9ARAC|nr:uncharacterized transposon-derived protein F54H12.3 [Trichonephila inaurata madagascariensis]
MAELSRKTGLSRKEVSDFLHQQDVYTKHKPLVRKFKRRRIYVSHINDQWQADLLFVYKFARSKHNDGTQYLLTVIDCFSKYAWAIPLKDKSSNEVTQAFKKIFKKKESLKRFKQIRIWSSSVEQLKNYLKQIISIGSQQKMRK